MRRLIHALALIGLLVPSLFSVNVRPARAATFTVNSTADTADALLTDNICDTDLGTAGEQCTLRAAVQQANALAGDDTIILPVATISLSGASGENSAASGDLDITGNLTITGSSAAGSIVNGGADRVFHVLSGANLNLSNLSVGGGNPGGAVGGGIYVESGSLTLNNVIVTGNTASQGGGIYTTGSVTINNTAVLTNTAALAGGGLYVPSGVTATINNSTFSGNVAGGTGATDGGGGIYSAGTTNLNSATVAANSAAYAGGGVLQFGGAMNLRNTLIGDNVDTDAAGGTFPDCSGTVNSLGYNLVENSVGCTGVANGVNNDKTGADAALAPLANNGGPTLTHAIPTTSIAIDAGNPGGCGDGSATFAYDQRGYVRSQDGNNDGVARCDIGAYEAVNPGPLTPTVTFTPSLTPTFTHTPSATPVPSNTSTSPPTGTPAPSATFTHTPTLTPSATFSLTPDMAATATAVAVFVATNATPTPSATVFVTESPTPSPTLTPSITPTITPVFILPADDASISTAGAIGSGGGNLTCGIFLVSAGPATVGDRTVFRCETVDPQEEASARRPWFYRPIWHIVRITAQDSLGGEIAQFSPPLSICAYYSPDHLDAAGGDPNRLVIYTAPGRSNTWTAMETTAEPEARRVCATTSRLSRFRLLAKPAPWLERFTGTGSLLLICAAAMIIVLLTTVIFIVIRAVGGRGKKQPAKP